MSNLVKYSCYPKISLNGITILVSKLLSHDIITTEVGICLDLV